MDFENLIEDAIELLHDYELDGADETEIEDAIKTVAFELLGEAGITYERLVDRLINLEYGRLIGVDEQFRRLKS